MNLSDVVLQLAEEVSRLRQVVKSQMRFGTVHSVDPGGYRARLLIGPEDGNPPFLTPPRPWSEIAGDTRSWSVPSVGQQMLCFAPGGRLRQSLLIPAGFSDAVPAPHNGADMDVIAKGEARQALHADTARLFVNGDNGNRHVAHADGVKMRAKDTWLVIKPGGYIRASHPIELGPDPLPF